MNDVIKSDYIDESSIMPMHVTPLIANTRIRKLDDHVYRDGDTHKTRTKLRIPHLNALDNEIHDLVSKSVKKMILVCDDRNTARRAARYVMMQSAVCTARTKEVQASADYTEFMAEMDEELQDLYDEASEVRSDVFEVSFDTIAESEKSVDNAYLKSVVTEMISGVPFLFTGFEDGHDISRKLEALKSIVTKDPVFVWIRSSQRHEPWVLDLEMNEEYGVLKIESPTDAYYEKMFERMLIRTGTKLQDGVSVSEAVMMIRRRLGALFDEQSLDWMFRQALDSAQKRDNDRSVLCLEDFCPDYDPDDNALNRLMRMTGLGNLKRTIKEDLALKKEQSRNPKLKKKQLHGNMIFCGNPGTGKTTSVRIYAECMAEGAGSNGVFVIASREDLIGKYVGHTSPKIAQRFKEAEGGVLFIDEAGFFLNNDSGGYVREALKELVRYMEIMPDVTVIFGMYEREVPDFLALDEGLRSRISQIIRFEDYTDQELLDIAEYMCEENGYRLDEQCRPHITKYMKELRGSNDFGNAREVRRLIENALRAHSIALYDDSGIGLKAPTDPDTISVSDIKGGIERSRDEYGKDRPKRKIGFSIPEEFDRLIDGTAINL
ncbi:MAG: AAA family ATPase [Eubacterium sp.]|nr:AAA family ATPase [Eubacterium sp.]